MAGVIASKRESCAASSQSHCPNTSEYISVLAFGSRVQAAVDAAEAFAVKHEIGVRVVNMRFIKPLDTQMLDDLASSTSLFVTVEEHAVMGGARSGCPKLLAQRGNAFLA